MIVSYKKFKVKVYYHAGKYDIQQDFMQLAHLHSLKKNQDTQFINVKSQTLVWNC